MAKRGAPRKLNRKIQLRTCVSPESFEALSKLQDKFNFPSQYKALEYVLNTFLVQEGYIQKERLEK